MKMKDFTFSLVLEDALTIDDIWPDGDAPENPTAADVMKQLRKDGGNALEALLEWNMEDEAELTILNNKDYNDKAEWY
jgi:hypothetical protein